MIEVGKINSQALKISQVKSDLSASSENALLAENTDFFASELASLLGESEESSGENSETQTQDLYQSELKSNVISPSLFDPELVKNVDSALTGSKKEVSSDLVANLLDSNVKLNESQSQGIQKNSSSEISKLEEILTKESNKLTDSVESLDVLDSKLLKSQKPEQANEKKILATNDFLVEKQLAKKINVNLDPYGAKKMQLDKRSFFSKEDLLSDVSGLKSDKNLLTQKVEGNRDIFEMKSDEIKNTISLPELNFKSEVESNKSDQVKTLQFSDIKSSDSNEIINQITDYISQAKASKEKEVNLKLNHDELGLIDISVKKSPLSSVDNNISLTIGTQSLEGRGFFTQNSKELISHLNQMGISISDLKVEHNQSSAKNDFNMNQRDQQGQSFGDRQFGSEQNQRKHDQNRREELWDILRHKEVA